MAEEENKIGGRKHLDGSLPGDGEYLVRTSVTLRVSDFQLIERLGGTSARGRHGTARPNRSAGIRALADFYNKHHAPVESDAGS